MRRLITYNYGEQVGEAIFLHEIDFCVNRKAKFKCRCGNTFFARISAVRLGYTKSCGCIVGKNPNSRNHNTHSLRGHKLYNVWCAMKARCYNKNRTQYKDYGGKGVVVCEEWKNDFEKFYNWAISNGWKDGLQLDKDSRGDGMIYSPSTCCFLTSKQNNNKRNNNKLIEFNGQCKTIPEWSSITGVNKSTITTRLSRGWDIEKALTIM